MLTLTPLPPLRTCAEPEWSLADGDDGIESVWDSRTEFVVRGEIGHEDMEVETGLLVALMGHG